MGSDPSIAVVGVGGSGSLVAEGLCRLFTDYSIPMYLVDPDRIEPQNLLRQNFLPEEVGRFKAEALATRLSRQYGRVIRFSVMPYEVDMFPRSKELIIIGCVDGPDARQSIEGSITWDKWWIDSGNSYNSGQVLIGNTREKEQLAEAFDSEAHLVRQLPVPSLQQPALLLPAPKLQPDCAEAIIQNEQSPIINQVMATLILDMVNRLLRGTLNYMGVYLDMEAGSMQRVPATPITMARMMSMKTVTLMANKVQLTGRYNQRMRMVRNEDGTVIAIGR
jgi:PRTRC genetic system ThiF family protein